ncbi:MAG: TetR/AcrR family transcriptional regulator, partial [Planctomycetota bacterium]
MGRPNLAEVRKVEILDAFERCVARFGLEGSSLEHIADEAGMKRSILRHYIGNRDDLVEALAGRVVQKYRGYVDCFVESVSSKNRVNQLIDFLFPN